MHARKRFGQHFLIDDGIIHRIIDVLHIKNSDTFVEIGPGQGVLTRALLNHLDHLFAIEIDRDLVQYLKQHFAKEKLTLYEQDVLKFDFNILTKINSHTSTVLNPSASTVLNTNTSTFRLIGNLPYNITTPLLFHALHYSAHIQDMHFMIQKEVADRIVATQNNKIGRLGRLSIMIQYFCEPSILFEVPKEAFKPPPKVHSAVIRLKPYHTLPYVAQNYDLFCTIVRKAFSERRKTIHNSLKEFITDDTLRALNLDPKQRPETLSVKNFVDISNSSTANNSENSNISNNSGSPENSSHSSHEGPTT